jgi:hypothetical protein
MATKASKSNYRTKNLEKSSTTLKKKSKLNNFLAFLKFSIKKSTMAKSLFRNRIEACIEKEEKIG